MKSKRERTREGEREIEGGREKEGGIRKERKGAVIVCTMHRTELGDKRERDGRKEREREIGK